MEAITYEIIDDIKGPKIIIYTTYDKKYYIHNKINSILDQIKKNYFLIESYDENLFNILIDNKQQYDSLSSQIFLKEFHFSILLYLKIKMLT